MANEDDEFGFKSLAEAFKPEVVRQETATTRAAQAVPSVVSQPVPTRPVTPRAATPSLPEVKPEEVAASVPQVAVPELPAIQNPVFNPEFQKAAGVAALPAALGGAALGAAAGYGLYKGRKSIQDRSIGKPMTAPPEFGGNLGQQLQGMDMSKVSPSDLKLLQEYEAKRVARQTAAQPEINKQMGFAQPATPAPVVTNPVPAQTPPTIQATIETPKITLPETAGPVAPNPVAQAAAQTAPVAPPTVAQLAQEAAPAVTTAAQAPAESIPPTKEEKNKGGRPKKGEAKQWTYESSAQLPEGTVFKEGWGGADNWLNDQVGKEKAKEIRNMFNQGRGFGSGKDAMLAAAQAMQDAGQQKFMTQGEPFVLSGENRERFGIAPPKQQGRLSKTFEKAVKVGGVTGLLLTAAEAANAKQAAQNVGEALLPIGMTPSELASGTLTKKQLEAYKEAQKLGSPYRSVPPR